MKHYALVKTFCDDKGVQISVAPAKLTKVNHELLLKPSGPGVHTHRLQHILLAGIRRLKHSKRSTFELFELMLPAKEPKVCLVGSKGR
jgi:hypothetical protein